MKKIVKYIINIFIIFWLIFGTIAMYILIKEKYQNTNLLYNEREASKVIIGNDSYVTEADHNSEYKTATSNIKQQIYKGETYTLSFAGAYASAVAWSNDGTHNYNKDSQSAPSDTIPLITDQGILNTLTFTMQADYCCNYSSSGGSNCSYSLVANGTTIASGSWSGAQGGYNTSNHTTGITINLFSIKNIPTDTSNLTLNLYAHAWGSNDFGYYCSASISGVTGTYLKLS